MASVEIVSNDEILAGLRQIHARYPKPGALKRPLARKALKQWVLTTGPRVPLRIPVKYLYMLRQNMEHRYRPDEVPNPVPAFALAMLQALAIGLEDPGIAADRPFRDLLPDLDPFGHRFCGLGAVYDALADPDSQLGLVGKASASVFDFTRDTVGSDMNTRHVSDFLWLLMGLTDARHERRVVVDAGAGRQPVWVRSARGVKDQIGGLARDFGTPALFGPIIVEADRIERQTEDEVRGLPGYEEVSEQVAKFRPSLLVRDFRATVREIGLWEDLHQWLVC
jgi:hypothetical protein